MAPAKEVYCPEAQMMHDNVPAPKYVPAAQLLLVPQVVERGAE